MISRVVATLLLSSTVVPVECFMSGSGKIKMMHQTSSSLSSSSSSSSGGDDVAVVRGIIFDIDGTLADSWNLGYQATKTVLTEYHNNKSNNGEEESGQHTTETYPLTAEEYHFGCRYTTPERLARHVGLEPGHPSFDSVGEDLGRQFDNYYVALVSISTAGFYSGISELLVKLHCGEISDEGVQLGALTNACVDYAHAVLKANCPDNTIHPRFTTIHGADSVPRAKPFGDGILQCCEEMNLHPSQVIYVGDAPTDGKASAAAKCKAGIGVLWGSNSEEVMKEEKGFNILCSSVDELEIAIKQYL